MWEMPLQPLQAPSPLPSMVTLICGIIIPQETIYQLMSWWWLLAYSNLHAPFVECFSDLWRIIRWDTSKKKQRKVYSPPSRLQSISPDASLHWQHFLFQTFSLPLFVLTSAFLDWDWKKTASLWPHLHHEMAFTSAMIYALQLLGNLGIHTYTHNVTIYM